MLNINTSADALDNFYYHKRAICDPEVVLGEIRNIIENRHAISNARLNARVFIRDGTRDEYGLKISDNPPLVQEELHIWLERITKAKSFCTVINGINGWSDNITSRLDTDFIQRWLKNFCIPNRGFDVYVFMGRYQITPFGIHKDREHTFLYHLGPNSKQAFLWDPADLEITARLTKNPFDLHGMASLAHRVTLDPGDSIFIPKGWYHVLESSDFSATLGIAPYESEKSELLTLLVSNLLAERNVDNKMLQIKHSELDGSKTDLVDSLCESVRDQSLLTISETGLDRHLNALKSNNYFKYSSPPRKIVDKTYRYFGKLIVGADNGKFFRIHCRGRTLLVRSEFKSKIKAINELITSPTFCYRPPPAVSHTFLHSFLARLITLGVLV